MTPEERDRFHRLLMAAIDSELTADEDREFQKYLADFPECRQELESYQSLKEKTMQLKFKDQPAEVWDRYWLGVYRRMERGIAWILVSLGATVVLTYGLVESVRELIAEEEMGWGLKSGILALIAGLVILLVSVVREKLFVVQSDKYTEVQR